MFLGLLIVFMSLALLLDYAIKKRRNDMTASLPGTVQIPLVGNYYIFTLHNEKDAERVIKDHTKRYNGFSRAWVFNQLCVMISRPKELELILSSTKHIKKSFLYDILQIWLGEGLLVSTDSKWHARQKVITPAFHFKILEQFVEIFDQQSSVIVEKLKMHSVDGEAFNIYPYVTLATLDVVCETAMGVKVHAQTDPSCVYVKAVTEVFASKERKRQQEALKELHDFTEDIIEERRASLEKKTTEKSDIEGPSEEDIGTKKKMALLDVLLQSTINGNPLTNSDIREEVDTFMFEGHDTTASAISFALYSISRHPDIQEKMFNEIMNVIGSDKNKAVTYNELQELKYVEKVIKESMRMFPPVPMIGRQFTEDVDINGVTIPAGTDFSIPIFVMMKNPDIFPDPEKFDPERHSLENTTEKSISFAYIPFSAGPRNCVGQKFAMLEMKSMISKVLRHYELLAVGDDPDPVMNFVLRSTNGINLGIKTRLY